MDVSDPGQRSGFPNSRMQTFGEGHRAEARSGQRGSGAAWERLVAGARPLGSLNASRLIKIDHAAETASCTPEIRRFLTPSSTIPRTS